ncbi:MerR family transcriptional regulator [Mycetocola miduiensis]|uniref:DNA-binding transcriptional regulator, MerR family n=1 Tax=Mycetocola miduiensis TaxID=995034 RepID=A0A1I4YG41_9MICO|nr:MerR family transcriptional regulator [Mycetocola miduiensis]SFN36569.1 DNA-binding transcriptional regulator, MerR family [Mycetocola miduiensis]
MRISALVERTGVPLATVKYYLREGLLPPGISTGATQADYTEDHVHRLQVIKALTSAAGLPLQKVKIVLSLIDAPGSDLFSALGQAVASLPPYRDEPATEHPRARALLERIGQLYDPAYPATAQLEHALEAAEEAGIGMSDERLEVYARQIRGIAEYDLQRMGSSELSPVEYAVLGTALYEPVLLAMRRLAHQDIAAKRLGGSAG